MREVSLAPYLLWAKTRQPAAIDLAGSNLLPCTLADLPGARDAVDLTAPNDLGYPPLVEAIAAHYGVPADRVATGAGCSGANFLAIAALVSAGDRVVVEQPTYDPLIGACRLMGAEIVRVARRFEPGYAIDLDDLRQALERPARLVVLTTPHNPSGVRLSPEALAAIGALAARAGAHVLVDEVYLDGATIASGEAATAGSAAALDGPFVVTNSLTKSYGLAGLRCGWIIAAPDVAERVRRTRDLVDNIGAAPADRLSAFAFARLPQLAERTRAILTANLDHARRFIAAQRDVEVAAPPGSSVMFPRLRDAERGDAGPFVRQLLERHGVAVAPGAFFEAPAHFRVSLAGDPVALERGLAAIAAALDEHARGLTRHD
jgi:aspartate/methionine/tyrosine aminotransferase